MRQLPFENFFLKKLWERRKRTHMISDYNIEEGTKVLYNGEKTYVYSIDSEGFIYLKGIEGKVHPQEVVAILSLASLEPEKWSTVPRQFTRTSH